MRTKLRILVLGVVTLHAAVLQAQLDPAPGTVQSAPPPAPTAPPPPPVATAPVMYAPGPVESAPPPPPRPWRTKDAGLIIAAERMTALHLNWVSWETSDGTTSGDSLFVNTNLLWANAVSGEGFNPYAIPYLALHGVIGPGLTVGGNIGLYSNSGQVLENNTDEFGNRVNNDLSGSTGVILAPRFGVLLPVGNILSFWIRGGFAFYALWGTNPSVDPLMADGEWTERGLAISLDPMLVIAPVPHVGLMVGPIIDLGLWGESGFDSGSVVDDSPLRISNFGLAAGIALFL